MGKEDFVLALLSGFLLSAQTLLYAISVILFLGRKVLGLSAFTTTLRTRTISTSATRRAIPVTRVAITENQIASMLKGIFLSPL